jgi:hypothetical protein
MWTFGKGNRKSCVPERRSIDRERAEIGREAKTPKGAREVNASGVY